MFQTPTSICSKRCNIPIIDVGTPAVKEGWKDARVRCNERTVSCARDTIIVSNVMYREGTSSKF